MKACILICGLLLSFLSSLLAAGQVYKCESQNLQVDKLESPLDIQQLNAAAEYVSSSGNLFFRNNTHSKIVDHLFLFELYAENNKKLFTVAVVGRRSRQKPIDQLWLEAHNPGSVNEGPPGRLSGVSFESPLVPSECPIKARIVGLYLQFQDGHTFSAGFKNYVLDPVLVSAKNVPSVLVGDKQGTSAAVGLRIDPGGHIVEAHSSQLSLEAIDFLKSWQFSPFPGRAPVDLTLVLYFGPLNESGQKQPEALRVNYPATSEVVQLTLGADGWVPHLLVGSASIGPGMPKEK